MWQQTCSAAAARRIPVETMYGSANDVRVDATGVTVTLNDGRAVSAQRLALCLGNFRPAAPTALRHAKLLAHHYLNNPWAWDSLAHIKKDAAVLVIGTGLTMVDVLLALQERGFGGHVTAVSRHGLLPQRHASTAQPFATDWDQVPATTRDFLRAVRHHANESGEWRAVIDSLRSRTPHLWQRLGLAQQQRFLRHVKAYWDVHRHRLAPEIADTVAAMRRSGRLTIIAGRLLSVTADGEQVQVTLRRRHTEQSHTLNVGHVVNCTGGITTGSITTLRCRAYWSAKAWPRRIRRALVYKRRSMAL